MKVSGADAELSRVVSGDGLMLNLAYTCMLRKQIGIRDCGSDRYLYLYNVFTYGGTIVAFVLYISPHYLLKVFKNERGRYRGTMDCQGLVASIEVDQ